AVIVRSRHAHGIIRAIDTSVARAMPGVLGAYTAADLPQYGTLKCVITFPNRDGSEMSKPPRPVLAADRVRFVGDPLAFVVAETLLQAKDAAEAVTLDLEPRAAVTKPKEAIRPGAPLLYDQAPNNISLDYHYRDAAKVAAAFAHAAHVAKVHLVNNRLVVNAVEPRAAVGTCESDGRYTLHVESQGVFGLRANLAQILGVEPKM